MRFVLRYCYRASARVRVFSDGRAYFAGHRPPRTVECLVCNKSIVQHELVKHMMVEHNMEAMEAGESAGLAMRKTWSKD